MGLACGKSRATLATSNHPVHETVDDQTARPSLQKGKMTTGRPVRCSRKIKQAQGLYQEEEGGGSYSFAI